MLIDTGQSQVQAKIAEALVSDSELGVMRAQAGDVFVGARIAGADADTARTLAVRVHTTPELLARVSSMGGLLVGATEFLHDIDSAVADMKPAGIVQMRAAAKLEKPTVVHTSTAPRMSGGGSRG